MYFECTGAEVYYACRVMYHITHRVADLHHFNAELDPAFHFDADSDLALLFNEDPDPDPAPHQSNANLRPLVYRPSRAPF
jgi:hypothetical protein